jgi:lambda repressor-like predicted transcriptional regulator
VKRYRRLRRLRPDGELYRRRAAGESVRALAPDYGVAHTTLSRHFARPEAAAQVKQAGRLLRAERRALAARAHAPGKSEPSRADQRAARAVEAGGGIQAVIEATGLRTLKNVLGLSDPAVLAQAFANDEARARGPRLRRLRPDADLYRRRADGESLRALARDYAVAHTTLSRQFARTQPAKELKRAARSLRAERRAAGARLRDEQKAAREARRLAPQQVATKPVSAHPPRPGKIIRPRGGFNW